MREGFIEIPGFPGYYICEEGLIYSAKRNRFLAWQYNTKGYTTVRLYANGRQCWFLLHRLVAILFVPNPDPAKKVEVNHNDFDKSNPSAYNLAWMTPIENRKYNAKKSWAIDDSQVYCPF